MELRGQPQFITHLSVAFEYINAIRSRARMSYFPLHSYCRETRVYVSTDGRKKGEVCSVLLHTERSAKVERILQSNYGFHLLLTEWGHQPPAGSSSSTSESPSGEIHW